MGQHDPTADARVCAEGFREVATSEGIVRLPDIPVSSLSLGEHLLIWRRREGLTQKQAGPRLGIGRNAYQEIERQDTKCRLAVMPHIGTLYSHEICFILRRRSGWTIPQCAEQAGVSRYWYNLMEQGKASPDRLITYWGENEGEQ